MYWCVGCYIDRVGNFALQQIAYAGRMSQYSEFETIYFKSIRIINECSTIYTSSRKQTTKINELLPLHNVQYEKNTDLSGRPIQKKYSFRLYNTEE
jgi:hypothetical protein